MGTLSSVKAKHLRIRSAVLRIPGISHWISGMTLMVRIVEIVTLEHEDLLDERMDVRLKRRVLHNVQRNQTGNPS